MDSGCGPNAANDDPSMHVAAQARSYRVPSPPRIFVPPPLLYSKSGSDLNPFTQNGSNDIPSDNPAANFLATINLPQFRLRQNVTDWKYEERRKAQEILPFLYLGPAAAARDRNYLKNSGITMVLGVRDAGLSALQASLLEPKAPKELGLEMAVVELGGNHALIPAFKRAFESINGHLAPRFQSWTIPMTASQVSQPEFTVPIPGKVLAFCESGNERSAALVAAYIMAMYSLDLVRALQIVQSQRFCVSVDDNMRHILRAFQDVLNAHRDVGQHQLGGTNGRSRVDGGPENASRASKRSIDDAYEDDEMNEVGQSKGGDWSERRAGVAPFAENEIP